MPGQPQRGKLLDPDHPICGVPTKVKKDAMGNTWPQGRPCSRPAGLGTAHEGQGPCALHGGQQPLTRWRYGGANREGLDAALDELRKDSAHDDLREELVLLRCLIKTYLAETQETKPDSRRYEIETLVKAVEAISKVLDQMERLRRGYNISMEALDAVTEQMALKLAGVVRRFITDEDQRAAFLAAVDKAWDAISMDPGGKTTRNSRSGL